MVPKREAAGRTRRAGARRGEEGQRGGSGGLFSAAGRRAAEIDSGAFEETAQTFRRGRTACGSDDRSAILRRPSHPPPPPKPPPPPLTVPPRRGCGSLSTERATLSLSLPPSLLSPPYVSLCLSAFSCIWRTGASLHPLPLSPSIFCPYLHLQLSLVPKQHSKVYYHIVLHDRKVNL